MGHCRGPTFFEAPKKSRAAASRRRQTTQVYIHRVMFKQFPTIWRGQSGSVPYVYRTVWGPTEQWDIAGPLTLPFWTVFTPLCVVTQLTYELNITNMVPSLWGRVVRQPMKFNLKESSAMDFYWSGIDQLAYTSIAHNPFSSC